MTDFRHGDVFLYPSIDRIPGFKAIAIGQGLLGVPTDAVHCGVWIDGGEASAYMDIGTAIARKYPYPCQVYRPVDGDVEKGLVRIRALLGRPYGWDGLAWLAFVRRFGMRRWLDRRPDRPFCSSLIAEGAREGGWFANPFYPCETAPGDLAHVGLRPIGHWRPED